MKLFAKKEDAEKMKELLREADSHPLMKKILEEKSAAVLLQRTEAAEKIAGLVAERDAKIPRLRVEVEATEKVFLEAKTAMAVAAAEHNLARQTLASESHVFAFEIAKQQELLLGNYDTALDDASAFFTEKLEWLRAPGRVTRSAGGAVRHIGAWKKITSQESNSGAVGAALQFCQSAIRALEQMKLVPEVDLAAIERLKAGIPSIEIYTEFSSEKSLPK